MSLRMADFLRPLSSPEWRILPLTSDRRFNVENTVVGAEIMHLITCEYWNLMGKREIFNRPSENRKGIYTVTL